ncbi:MAG: hypothetical protein ACREL1_02760 [bacterium]
MSVHWKWGLMFFLFPPLALCLPAGGFSGTDLNACALCLRAGHRSDLNACLAALDGKVLSALSGNGKPIGGRPTHPKAVFEICESISDGNGGAMDMGFRLGVILNDAPEEEIVEALGGSMMKNPSAFLISLQSMMDFSGMKKISGPFEEYFWNAFMETDFGYQGPLEEEAKEMRRRKGMVLNLKDPAVKEARRYILEMLDEKIQALPTGM